MAAQEVELYLRRAKDFYEAMVLLDEPQFANASALLAIHSAISNSDALRLGLGFGSVRGDNHATAADSLSKLLRTRGFEDISGITTFRYLLKMKSTVAYGAKRLDSKESKRLTESARRFSAWATHAGQQLKIEGWRYDNE